MVLFNVQNVFRATFFLYLISSLIEKVLLLEFKAIRRKRMELPLVEGFMSCVCVSLC